MSYDSLLYYAYGYAPLYESDSTTRALYRRWLATNTASDLKKYLIAALRENPTEEVSVTAINDVHSLTIHLGIEDKWEIPGRVYWQVTYPSSNSVDHRAVAGGNPSLTKGVESAVKHYYSTQISEELNESFDSELRRLEIAWRTSGSPEDTANYRRALMRTGDYLGYNTVDERAASILNATEINRSGEFSYENYLLPLYHDLVETLKRVRHTTSGHSGSYKTRDGDIMRISIHLGDTRYIIDPQYNQGYISIDASWGKLKPSYTNRKVFHCSGSIDFRIRGNTYSVRALRMDPNQPHYRSRIEVIPTFSVLDGVLASLIKKRKWKSGKEILDYIATYKNNVCVRDP